MTVESGLVLLLLIVDAAADVAMQKMTKMKGMVVRSLGAHHAVMRVVAAVHQRVQQQMPPLQALQG